MRPISPPLQTPRTARNAASIALALTAAVCVTIALAIGSRPPPTLVEHRLVDGPTHTLPLADAPVLYGRTIVKSHRTRARDTVLDITVGSASALTDAGPLPLPPPSHWSRVPGWAIAGSTWHWHASLPNLTGGPFVAQILALRPDDVVCTDGGAWWVAPCREVAHGHQTATRAALALLLGTALICGASAIRLVRP
ncbi:MAG: hypothetical protein ACI8PZ_004320 [Myxococcota bacterium]